MAGWVLKGLATGMKTTCYPASAERAPGVSPGRPVGGDYPEGEIPLVGGALPGWSYPASRADRRNGRLSPLHSLLSLHARPGNTVGLGTRIRMGGRLAEDSQPTWAVRSSAR